MIGCDDWDGAAEMRPALATANQPFRNQGRLAARKLRNRIIYGKGGVGRSDTVPMGLSRNGLIRSFRLIMFVMVNWCGILRLGRNGGLRFIKSVTMNITWNREGNRVRLRGWRLSVAKESLEIRTGILCKEKLKR